MRRVSALEELGGDLTETRKNLHKAFVSSPGPSRDAMADAWSLVNEEERLLLPSIRVEVQRSTSKDGWSRMSIVLVNEGGIAVGLRAGAKGNVRGALPDALPLGKRRAEIEVRDNASVRLFYRPLCSAKEEVDTCSDRKRASKLSGHRARAFCLNDREHGPLRQKV